MKKDTITNKKLSKKKKNLLEFAYISDTLFPGLGNQQLGLKMLFRLQNRLSF